MSQAISTIELLEQQNEALNNQAITEMDYQLIHADLEKSESELRKAQQLLAILQAERNTLSQVVRIQASQGRIDPVRETDELEMMKEYRE